MSKSDDRIAYLARIPLFSQCTKKELKRLDQLAELRMIPAGTEVIAEGTAGDTCFLIVDGTVSVRRKGRQIALLGPGESFGELAALDPGPRTASVSTLTNVEAVVFGPEELMTAIRDAAPELAVRLLRGLARRLRVVDTEAYG